LQQYMVLLSKSGKECQVESLDYLEGEKIYLELDEIQLFSGMSSVEQARILGKMNQLRLPLQTVIFEQDTYGDCMYVILNGSVDLLRGDQLLTTIKEGDILGEMALLSNIPRSATAVTATEVVLFEISRKVLQEILAENSSVSLFFIRLLTDRLIKTNDSLQENKKTNTNVINKRLGSLPEEVKYIILSAAILPQPVPLKLWSESEIKAVKSLLPLVSDFLNIERDFFNVQPAVKSVLANLFNSISGKDQKSTFTIKAAMVFWSEKMYAQAVETFIQYDHWQKAIKIIEENFKSLNPELLVPIFEKFLACPNEILFINQSFFNLLVDKLINHNNKGVLEKLLSAIDSKVLFSEDQLSRMYEKSAEIYRSHEDMQKALEYMNLAALYAEGLENVASANASGGSEGRTYQLAKQSLGRITGKLLVERASNLFAVSKPITIAITVLALMAIWCFSFITPFVGLSREGMLFLGIALGAVALWITEIIPAYITALLMSMIWVLTGITTTTTALSGFATSTWLFIISILGLGAAISKSGLMFRLSLRMLKAFPKNYLGQLFGLAASGLLFTPLLPSSMAKVALAAPISRSIVEAMRFSDQSDASAGLTLTAMIFSGYLAPFFMTGSYANMMTIGLIQGYTISWLSWLLYALPALLLFSGVAIGALIYRFRPENNVPSISPEVLEKQLLILGSMSRAENITLLVTFGSIMMMSLQFLHHIDNAWIMLTAFIILILGKVLDQNTIKNDIDWMFLLFIGIAFSMANVASDLGVVTWITTLFESFMQPFLVSPYLFLPAIIVIIFLITLVIRDVPALILLTLSLTPLANQAGIHPWVLVFVILLTTDSFFFPYQSPTYLMAYYSTSEKAFNHRQGRFVAFCYGIIVLLTVALCIPYWRFMGLIW